MSEIKKLKEITLRCIDSIIMCINSVELTKKGLDEAISELQLYYNTYDWVFTKNRSYFIPRQNKKSEKNE